MKILIDPTTKKVLIDPSTKKVLAAIGSRSAWELNNYGALNKNVSTAEDTYDIVVDGNGNIYVAGKRNSEAKTIWVYDRDWNLLWSTGQGTGAYSSGIAVDSNGNVYVTGVRVGSKSVWKYNSNLVFQDSIDTGGNTFRIVVDVDDNIYVTGERNNNIGGVYKSIWSFDSGLNLRWAKDIGISPRDVAVSGSYAYFCGSTIGNKNIWKRYTSNGNVANSFLAGIHLYSIDIDSSGNIYIAGDPYIPASANAWALNSSGAVIWTYNTFSSYLFDIKVDSDGYVYLAGYCDRNKKTVWKVKGISAAEEKVWGYNTMSVPRDVAVDSSGNVYIAGVRVQVGGTWGNVWKLNSSGILQWKADTAPGGTVDEDANGIAIDSSGKVYVACKRYNNKNIRQFNSDGSSGWSADTTGAYTYKVAIDSSGNIYVTGNTVGDINLWKYSSTGEPLQSITIDVDLGRTYAIIIDEFGNIYVSGDYFNGGGNVIKTTIWKLNSAGEILWSYTVEDLAAIWRGIWDIAIDRSGVYIAVAKKNYIRKLSLSTGDLVWGYDFVDAQLCTGIVIDSEGNFYAGFWTHPLYYIGRNIGKLDSSGRWTWFNFVSCLGCYSIAIDPSDNIYVTGDHCIDMVDTVKKLQCTKILEWAYATRISYNVDTFANAVAVDGDGKVYIAGSFCPSEISDG